MKFLKFFLVASGLILFIFSCTKLDSNIPPSVGTLKINDTTGDCLHFKVHGAYSAGVPLTSDNYIDIAVDVTAAGTFDISTDSVNGMYFSTMGEQRFGKTDSNEIHLYSHGKPILPGLTTFTIEYGRTSCTVSLIVGNSPSGTFSFDTSGVNISTNTVVNGIYIAGKPLVSSDSVVLTLDVTKAGLLHLVSDTIDGMTFSGSTVFTTTGIQTITLIGNGIPQLSGKYNFAVIDSLSDSSKFTIIVAPFGGGTAVASFILGGASGSCTPFFQYGIYKAGVKLSSEDSVTAQVTVKSAGPYSVVTNASNGVVFSSTGTFDSAGVYTIALHGYGTPSAPGSFDYIATADSSSCGFRISYDQGPAIFTLGGTPQQCDSFKLSGVYKQDSALTINNTVTFEVDVVSIGAYSISLAPVNGITFATSGTFLTTGPQLITLTGTGTPVSYGTSNFAVPSRTGNCLFSINVLPAKAVFTIGSGPYGQCTGFKLNGAYKAGTALGQANYVLFDVNVTYPGPYSIISDSADGMVFSSIGTFTTVGTQSVKLTGSGIPKVSGGYNVNAGLIPYNCSFFVSVAPAGSGGGGAATFTLGGSPGSCSAFVPAGTYTAGTALGGANTVTTQVNVTATGSYSISTNTVNGISFSGSGTFATTGPLPVTLTGTGTPLAAGQSTYTATGGTSTCTFPITANPAQPPAAGSLVCSPSPVVSGTYTQNVSLNSSNTVQIAVNVTTAGSYNITTNTVAGISFSAAGVLSTGAQNITLISNGTPVASGSTTFTVSFGSGNCSFDVPIAVNTSPCPGLVLNTFKLSGFTTTGTALALLNPLNSEYELQIQGSGLTEKLTIDFPTTGGNAPAVGTYNAGSQVTLNYTDPNFVSDGYTWNASSGQVYISAGTGGALELQFCNVKFVGTSFLGGSTSATGQGSFEFFP